MQGSEALLKLIDRTGRKDSRDIKSKYRQKADLENEE